MKPLQNPFLVFGYHSPLYFCNRENETGQILDALQNNRNLTLIAPRRIGKTGLIHHVFHEFLKKKLGTTIYMDIFPTSNLNEFTRVFAETVLGSLDSDIKRLFTKIGTIIKSCRPTVRFDPITGNPEFSMDIDPGKEEATLKEVFTYLRTSDKQCVIAIDEFQQIAEYKEKRVEALLRSYIQHVPNVRFIFSGSKQHLMQELFLSAKRPFYQSTQLMSIDAIDKSDYYTFANTFFKDKGLKFNQSVFEELYSMFDGYTWYIQATLNRLYGYGESIVRNEQLFEAIDRLIAEYEYAYQNLISAYTPTAVKLLKAIAAEGRVAEINAGKFISKYNLKAASSVNTALSKLLKNEVVYKSEKGYIIYDRLMSIWLSRQP